MSDKSEEIKFIRTESNDFHEACAHVNIHGKDIVFNVGPSEWDSPKKYVQDTEYYYALENYLEALASLLELDYQNDPIYRPEQEDNYWLYALDEETTNGS